MNIYFGINKLFVADVVHMTCKQQTTAREDLKTVVAKLLRAKFSDSTTNGTAFSTHSPNKKQSEVDSLHILKQIIYWYKNSMVLGHIHRLRRHFTLINNILTAMNNKLKVGGIFCDLQKAVLITKYC
jgi:hypothetical protein